MELEDLDTEGLVRVLKYDIVLDVLSLDRVTSLLIYSILIKVKI